MKGAGDDSDWGWAARGFGGDIGVDFERLEVPLEAKRGRLEDFIVLRLLLVESSESKGLTWTKQAAPLDFHSEDGNPWVLASHQDALLDSSPVSSVRAFCNLLIHLTSLSTFSSRARRRRLFK